MSRLVKIVSALALIIVFFGAAASPVNVHVTNLARDQAHVITLDEASAASNSLSAWYGSWNYGVTGYGSVYCPNGGCYGNLVMNVYQNGQWIAGASSGYGTWANKTVSASRGCWYSRSNNLFQVIVSFPGFSNRGSGFYAYMSCY